MWISVNKNLKRKFCSVDLNRFRDTTLNDVTKGGLRRNCEMVVATKLNKSRWSAILTEKVTIGRYTRHICPNIAEYD